ncbi:hypothetical protein L211DRAFT_839888 [Terfezia boudieri ATCC MYA-4762]|uniref:Uncharacterized protein n=1 Tax=Terfezia boudieri ATCC MYA-4762 TaxID=1051890 RepID=A0A3N4LNK2_9PEZI|nr:hypothetical protein L211DRAFT_839888 [Terfezia boudieri ATCC MYA-4762]
MAQSSLQRSPPCIAANTHRRKLQPRKSLCQTGRNTYIPRCFHALGSALPYRPQFSSLTRSAPEGAFSVRTCRGEQKEKTRIEKYSQANSNKRICSTLFGTASFQALRVEPQGYNGVSYALAIAMRQACRGGSWYCVAKEWINDHGAEISNLSARKQNLSQNCSTSRT